MMIDHEKLNRFFAEKDRKESEFIQRRKMQWIQWELESLKVRKIRLWEALNNGDSSWIRYWKDEVVKAENAYIKQCKPDYEIEWMKSWEDAGGWR